MNKDLWNDGKKNNSAPVKRYMRKEFERWVERVYDDFYHNTHFEIVARDKEDYWITTRDARNCVNSTYTFSPKRESAIFINGNYTPIVLKLDKNKTYITNINTGKHGSSRKMQHDTYDLFLAVAIAWARYCKIPIPDVIFSADELSPGDKFIVKSNFVSDKDTVWTYISKNPLRANEHVVTNGVRYISVNLDEYDCAFY